MNPAMAGLGALTKQSGQPTGRSPESMSQTMALAKQMSDMQLADVLAGKSMNIPQYVAMTEAMGRKQLRTAMQGMTAMTSAKQPTEREKLLSEMMPRQAAPSIMNAPPQGAALQGAGLDQLPADNMQGLGHADGGIIAFKERGKVEEPDDFDVNNYQTDRDMGNAMRRRGQSFLGSVGEELGAFGRFIKNPFSSKDPKANYMRELEAQADRPLTEQELQLNRNKEAIDFRTAYRESPEYQKQLIQAQQMGEPTVTPPLDYGRQFYNIREGDPKKGLEELARARGLSPSDVERMQAAQANPRGPNVLNNNNFDARRTAKINEATANTAIARNLPEYEPVPATPAGRFIADQLTDIKGGMATDRLRQRLYEQYSKSADPFSKASDPERQAGQDMLSRIKNMTPAELRALEQQGNVSASAAVTGIAPPVSQLSRDGVDPTDASEFLNTLKTTGVALPKTGGTNTGGGPGGGGPGGGGPGGGGPGGGGAGGYGGGRLPQTNLSKFATEQAELLRPKERNKDYYAALEADSATNAKQIETGKNQAQGEFLMNIGAALMSTPNIGLAVSKGVQAGLPGLAASRKEINALTKDQRDYKFNIAKAKEARDQGDEMLSLNYLKLADQIEFHAGTIGVGMARAGNATAFGPKQYQAAMTNAQKEVDNRIGKMGPLDKRKLTPETRQQMIEDAFTRNLEAYRTGSIPTTQDPSLELFDNPGGPVLARPQK